MTNLNLPTTPASTQPHKTTPASLNPQLLILLGALILLGINIGIGTLLISASQESQTSLSHLEALERNRLSAEQLQADLNAHQGNIERMSLVLPQESDIPDFIQFVSEAGKVIGADISPNFSTNQPTKTKEGLYVIPFIIVYRGDPVKTSKLASALHEGIYQVRLKHLEVRSNGLQPADIRLEGEVFVASPATPAKKP